MTTRWLVIGHMAYPNTLVVLTIGFSDLEPPLSFRLLFWLRQKELIAALADADFIQIRSPAAMDRMMAAQVEMGEEVVPDDHPEHFDVPLLGDPSPLRHLLSDVRFEPQPELQEDGTWLLKHAGIESPLVIHSRVVGEEPAFQALTALQERTPHVLVTSPENHVVATIGFGTSAVSFWNEGRFGHTEPVVLDEQDARGAFQYFRAAVIMEAVRNGDLPAPHVAPDVTTFRLSASEAEFDNYFLIACAYPDKDASWQVRNRLESLPSDVYYFVRQMETKDLIILDHRFVVLLIAMDQWSKDRILQLDWGLGFGGTGVCVTDGVDDQITLEMASRALQIENLRVSLSIRRIPSPIGLAPND